MNASPGPHVSVTPSPHYHERYFAEALSQARAHWPAPSFEIVVADDSPGEAIGAAVAAAGDARVRYVRNRPARGFEGNFTFLLSQARGELVKLLNDDDRLRPLCLARLAGAFGDSRVTLATSRRVVIDASGNVQRDTPATTPISHASCTIEGVELGDLVLVNGLNLIGEPTTAMFRRDAIAPEAAGLFTWKDRSYRCLADLALWLRLLAKGAAYYHASPLSEYRVHPGQEQRAADMGISCITERLDLVRAAREAGFVAQPAQYRAALQRIDVLCPAWQPAAGRAELLNSRSSSSIVAARLGRWCVRGRGATKTPMNADTNADCRGWIRVDPCPNHGQLSKGLSAAICVVSAFIGASEVLPPVSRRCFPVARGRCPRAPSLRRSTAPGRSPRRRGPMRRAPPSPAG